MSRTKVTRYVGFQKEDLVTCYVGDKKVKCTLNPGWDFSMCSDKTLKRLGVKINRPISSEDREMKFFREMTSTPVGWSRVSLTFKSNKNGSIITDTEVLVVKYHRNMYDEILLGSPWFVGRSLMENEYDELQIYTARIVINMPDYRGVRTNLHIKSLRGHKNKWVRIPVDVKYRNPYEKSDSSSDSSSDSGSDSGPDSRSDTITLCRKVRKN